MAEGLYKGHERPLDSYIPAFLGKTNLLNFSKMMTSFAAGKANFAGLVKSLRSKTIVDKSDSISAYSTTFSLFPLSSQSFIKKTFFLRCAIKTCWREKGTLSYGEKDFLMHTVS